jgi:NAD(P)-dependent dehydrogenase (short-subunit alcohol dehydrogenase family)
MAADVREYAAVEAALAATVARWGLIDIVLSGAAGNFIAPASGLSANGFKTVVDIDLIGTFNVFRASYDHIRKPGASLIAITAGQAVQPMAGQIHACAAKAGVNMVTQCLALEWGHEGVRVNGISPGPIADTEGMRRLTPTPEAEAAYKATIPLGRYGEKRDIAELAIFLSSDSARYISGAIIPCDGASILTGGSASSFKPAG